MTHLCFYLDFSINLEIDVGDEKVTQRTNRIMGNPLPVLRMEQWQL